MPLPSRPCCHCRNWRPAVEREIAYMGDCALAERRTQYDDTCDDWARQPPEYSTTLSADGRREAMGLIRRTREGD